MTPSNDFRLMNALQQVSLNLPLDEFIQTVAQVYQHQMPTLRSIKLYRVSRGGLALWHNADAPDAPPSKSAFVSLTKVPQYHRVIEDGGIDYAPPLLVIGLRNATETFAILELELAGEDDLDGATIAQHAIAASYLAVRLDNGLLRSLFQRQASTLTQLSECRDFADIARVLAENLLESGQFITINLFEFDEDGVPYLLRTVATANRGGAFPADAILTDDRASLTQFYQEVSKTGDFLALDVVNDKRIPIVSRELLQAQKVRSIYGLGVRAEGRIVGVIGFNDTKRPLMLTPIETKTYQGLVRQAAVIIENRNMLARTASDLEELRTLYDLTSTLVQVTNMPEMLQVVYHTLGRNAHSVTLSEVEYDPLSNAPQLLIRYSTEGQGNVKEQDVTLSVADEKWRAHFLSEIQPIELVDDLPASNHPEAMYLTKLGVQRFAVVPVIENGRRTAQVTLAWRTTRPFDERTRRLLAAMQSQFALILQNQRLLASTRASAETARAQVALLRTLNEITNLANTQTDEGELLRFGMRILQESLQVDHVGIALLERSNRFFEVSTEYPNFGTQGVRLPDTNAPIARMRNTRDVLVINDMNDPKQLDEETRTILQSIGIKRALFVPMLDRQGKLYGSVGLDIYRDNLAFTPEMVDTARIIVSQLSLSLQKLMFYNTAQRQAKQIAQVNAFGQSVQATQDIETILDNAQDALRPIMPFEYFTVYIYENNLRALSMVMRSMNEETVHFNVPQPIALQGNSIVQQVWHDYEPQYVPQLSESPLWVHPLKGSLESIVAMPLVSGGQALGVIELASYASYAYDDMDITTLRQMSSQLAVALNNAATYARSQQQNIIKSRANDISNRLQQAVSIETMVRLTAEEVGRTLNAKRARVRLKPLGEKEE